MSLLTRRAALVGPLALVVVGGAGFAAMLSRMQQGKFDPRGVPSALVGKPVPAFVLPGLADGSGFASSELASLGRPVLLNFFASWCVPCVAEAEVLMALKRSGQPVFGVAYKDKADATAAFLREHGDPYVRLGRDVSGSVAIDFGLYGVPETYLIDSSGIVRGRWAGALTAEIVQQELMPLIKTLA